MAGIPLSTRSSELRSAFGSSPYPRGLSYVRTDAPYGCDAHKIVRTGASLNATAGRAVNMVEGGDSLVPSIYAMVAPVGKTSRKGGKQMAARIRRAVVAVALALLMVAALAGVAGGEHNTVPRRSTDPDGYCNGTDRNDVMYGTKGKDDMYARRGGHHVRARRARFTHWSRGPDITYGGLGNDYLGSDCDLDSWCGEDEKHGGRGDDHLVGNRRSEHHFGGRGDDFLVDDYSHEQPDTFRCGPGLDYVYYNKGLDKVAGNCEKLWAARPINVTPY